MPVNLEKVTDETSERMYYTQVCNLIDELDLSPLAVALYVHYKRWAGFKNHPSPGVKFLCQKFKCDSRAIKKAKDELVKNKLIKVRTFDPKVAKADEVTILDIWERNHKYFKELNPAPVVNQQQVGEKGGFQAPDPLLDNNSPVVNQQQPPLLDNNARKEHIEEHKEPKKAVYVNGHRLLDSKPPSLPTSVEKEINSWLAALAPLVGAKSAETIADFERWKATVKKAIKEQRDMFEFLEMTKTGLQTDGRYFTPESVLKKMQMQGARRQQGEWTNG